MKELSIPLHTDSKTPLYQQIYEAIRAAILGGKLTEDERLPSTRFQSEYLQVSRSTVETAYEQLLAEGYIYAVPYKGYYVCDVRELYRLSGESFAKKAEEKESLETKANLTESDGHPDQKKGTAFPAASKPEIDFSPYRIDAASFPYDTFGKILKNLMLDHRPDLLDAGPSFGDRRLRTLICEYLYRSRGVSCSPEQIVLGAGNEYLELLLAQILGKDCCVAMESPTYLQAYQTFLQIGYPVVEVEMDRDGMRSDVLSASEADLAYVMPSHQFPLGTVMPLKRRLELLTWAQEREKRYLIEDDYDSEFRYRGRPIPALQGMDRNGKVIYLGTFSRSIAPSVRVSYMVLPEPLLDRYRKRCGFYSCTVSNIMQQAISEFMETGGFEKNLNRMRRIYREKHDFLLGLLKEQEWVANVLGENAGLHILAEVNTSVAENLLVGQCRQENIRIRGLSEFYIHKKTEFRRPVLLFGYGGLSGELIREGIERFSKIVTTPV